MKTERKSRLVLLALGAAIIVLIGVTVALAMRPPAEFDPSTPEGTAQGYFQAVLDEDADAALGYVTPELADECNWRDFRYVTPDRARVVIVGTEISGDRAEVHLQITESWGEGPFDAGSDTFDETLVMERSGDRWLIARPPWPIDPTCG